jgi:hypothetical protein
MPYPSLLKWETLYLVVVDTACNTFRIYIYIYLIVGHMSAVQANITLNVTATAGGYGFRLGFSDSANIATVAT